MLLVACLKIVCTGEVVGVTKIVLKITRWSGDPPTRTFSNIQNKGQEDGLKGVPQEGRQWMPCGGSRGGAQWNPSIGDRELGGWGTAGGF